MKKENFDLSNYSNQEQAEEVLETMLDNNRDLTQEEFDEKMKTVVDFSNFTNADKVIALALLLEYVTFDNEIGQYVGDQDIIDDIDESSYNNYEYDTESKSYYVLDDDEANETAHDCAESEIDNILCQIPENLHRYFDKELFINDYVNNDGRGHIISGYDGKECQVYVDNSQYYIYRIN